jgi:hypothetical protein
MTEDLIEPLIYYDIDKELFSLQGQYRQFHRDIEAIDTKLNSITSKNDYNQLDNV